MTVGDRIRERRESLCMSQDELARKLGYKSRSSVNKIELNQRNITQSKIKAIADALFTTPSYIMGWTDEPQPTEPQHGLNPMPNLVTVPRLGRIACGTPIEAVENYDGVDTVPSYVRADFTLICQGDSMINARIFDGDIVCIHQQEKVESGEIAAVLVDENEATLKRVRIYPDHLVLEPENPKYRPISFWEDEMNRVRILGKATHFISAVR